MKTKRTSKTERFEQRRIHGFLFGLDSISESQFGSYSDPDTDDAWDQWISSLD